MRIYFSFFLFFLHFFCFGQDSFQALKKDLEQRMLYSDFKTALDLINKNRERYTDSEKADLDVMKTKILTEFGLYDEAFKLSQNLISNPKLTAEQKLKIRVERALIFEINDDAKSCLQELEKAANIFLVNPELKLKNYTNFLIRKSSYYRVNGFSKKAYDLANEAKEYAESVNDQVNMPVVELILGLGNRKTNLQKELQHYQRALYLYKNLNHNEAIISMYHNLSFFYFSEKDYRMSNIYIDSALAMASKSNVLNYKADIFQMKSDIMEKQNKSDSALYYYKTASEIYKEFNNEQRDLKVKELGLQYNFEKERSEKKQLQKNISNTRRFTISLLILLFGLLFFLWMQNKYRKKIENQRKKIAQKNEALQKNLEEKQFLVQELNHRVKNNLAVILSLIGFQKDQADNEDYKKRFDELYQRIKTITIAHELYSYNVNHNDDSYIEIKRYTCKIFETHFSSGNRNFSYDIDMNDIQLKVDRTLPLGLIINELITNSIKHAKPESDLLSLFFKLEKTEKGEIVMDYYDNGTEFSFDIKNDSLGIFIIEGMVKQLKGSYTREKANYKIVFPND